MRKGYGKIDHNPLGVFRMALVHDNYTVGTSPTLIVKIPEGVSYTSVQICNNHNQPIYVGTSDVAVSGATVGNAIAAGATLTIWLNANDVLYAVSSAVTTANSVSVIYSGV